MTWDEMGGRTMDKARKSALREIAKGYRQMDRVSGTMVASQLTECLDYIEQLEAQDADRNRRAARLVRAVDKAVGA